MKKHVSQQCRKGLIEILFHLFMYSTEVGSRKTGLQFHDNMKKLLQSTLQNESKYTLKHQIPCNVGQFYIF